MSLLGETKDIAYSIVQSMVQYFEKFSCSHTFAISFINSKYFTIRNTMIATMNRNNIPIPRTRDHGEEEVLLRTEKLQSQGHPDLSCSKASASIRETRSNDHDSVSSDTGSLDSSNKSS